MNPSKSLKEMLLKRVSFVPAAAAAATAPISFDSAIPPFEHDSAADLTFRPIQSVEEFFPVRL